MSYNYLPDIVKRSLDDLCTKSPDCFELGPGSVIRDDYCAWNIVLTGLPGQCLGHVSGAASVNSALLGIWTRKSDRIAGASNLKGAGGLQIL